MLDSAGLLLLHSWNDTLKAQKLEKIIDTKARNMMSRLLCKDPRQRMSAAAVLMHPFITGTAPVRMVGEAPKYDVFLSYRVASDAAHVQILYDKLISEEGVSVFWDKQCLQDGVRWEDGFCDSLAQSKVFVCLISREAIGHPTNSRQCFNRLTTTSDCDNVLLEHQLALEMQAMGLIEFVFPLFIGDKRIDGSHAPFDWGCYGALPDVVVSSVQEKLTGHLSRLALGVSLEPGRTVRGVVADTKAHQRFQIEGDSETAFESVKNKILGLCKTEKTQANQTSSSLSLLQTEYYHLQTERDELQVAKDRVQAENIRLRKEFEKENLQLRLQFQRAEAEQQKLQGERASSQWWNLVKLALMSMPRL